MSTMPETHYVVMVDGGPRIIFSHPHDADFYIAHNHLEEKSEVVPTTFVLYPTWVLGMTAEEAEEFKRKRHEYDKHLPSTPPGGFA